MSFRPMGWSAAFLLLAPRGYAQPPVALSIENIQTRNRGAFEDQGVGTGLVSRQPADRVQPRQ